MVRQRVTYRVWFTGGYVNALKRFWLRMAEPPWRVAASADERFVRWLVWGAGWAWVVAGLVLGAVVAPSLVRVAGLSGVPHQDWLVVGIAVCAGFSVQVAGWFVAVAVAVGMRLLLRFGLLTPRRKGSLRVGFYLFLLLLELPATFTLYAVFLYLFWVGPDQRAATVAFVGSLFVKMLVIPGIKLLIPIIAK